MDPVLAEAPANLELGPAWRHGFAELGPSFSTELRPTPLPDPALVSVNRRLATELGLAANTVARAYRELEEAGMVETRGRAGTFVSALGDRSRTALRQAAAEYAATAKGLGIDPAEALEAVRAALS